MHRGRQSLDTHRASTNSHFKVARVSIIRLVVLLAPAVLHFTRALTSKASLVGNMSGSLQFKTLLLDMDGVLAEVSKSYRSAIEMTCHYYGATSATQEAITECKIRGNANDDWKLSYDLIQADPHGRKDVTLQDVTDTFEKLYQGDGATGNAHTIASNVARVEKAIQARNWHRNWATPIRLSKVSSRFRSCRTSRCDILHGRWS
jgi:hypothetical protein